MIHHNLTLIVLKPQTWSLLEAVILNFRRAGAKGNIVDQVKIIVCVEEMMIVFVSLI